MTKPNKMGWLWMLCGGLLLCVASEAKGRERLWIQGGVAFEKRSTPVLLSICEPNCPDPEPYWALVIETQDGKKYELDQLFALGDAERPELIELEGVPLRPGTRLILDVTVDSVAKDYAVIEEIHYWDYRMDLRGISTGQEEPIWTCRSVDRADPRNEVQVYRKMQNPRMGDYELQWVSISSTESGDEVRRKVVARVPNVDVEVSPEDALFYGANLWEEAQLNLDLREQAIRNVPARFIYTRVVNGGPEKVAFEMTCSMKLTLR